MIDLRQWQATLAGAVLGEESAKNAMALKRIAERPGADRATRLAVYVQAYRLRGSEVLRGDFAALAHLVGDDAFDRLAGDYLAAHRSTHPSIRWLGRDFARFLESNDEPVWQVDLARFCWSIGEALDAADQKAVEATELTELAPAHWPGLKLRFHASFHLLTGTFDVAKSWQQAEDTGDCRTAPDALPYPVTWAIWRDPQGDVRWCRANPNEASLLQHAVAGENFAQLAESLQTRGLEALDAAAELAANMRHWLQRGWITRLEYLP